MAGRAQALALHGAGALPARLQRALAGDAAPGTLAPDVRLLLALVDRFGWPPFETLDPTAARAEIEAEAKVLAGRRERVPAVGLRLPSGARARLYRGGDGTALLVYFHGGGWVFGSVATHDGCCRFLARHGAIDVLSAEYRLAPEHPFPAAVEDAQAAVDYARTLGAGAVGVGGDSAGGNLAAVVARAADFQLLLYPITDAARDVAGADSPFLTAAQLRWFRSCYGAGEDPRGSPLRAADLSGLPPAYIAVAGSDPLRDEGVAYAHRLEAAGVPTVLALHDELPHAFAELTGVSRAARGALRSATSWLNVRVGARR